MRERWLRLMDIAVFGDLKAANPATLPRFRKRALDLGEKWRSLFADRSWIPQPREQLKNALGSARALRDSLLLVEEAARDITGGGDYAALEQELIALHRAVVGALHEREIAWATALERINRNALGDGAE